ncbi:MAG: hypothetical protein ABI758_03010 [Candidatus Woesebacteria bacterium]
MEHIRFKTEAAKIFAQAGGKYATSVTAQAAFIALSFESNKRKIQKAKKEILSCTEDIESVLVLANLRHQSLPPERRPTISTKRVRDVAADTFSFAKQVAILLESDLKNILQEGFPAQIEKNRFNSSFLSLGEIDFRHKVTRMIHRRQTELFLWGVPWQIHLLLEKKNRE